MTFAVGYRSVLGKLPVADQGVLLKALNDPTSGLATFLCRDVRDRSLRTLAGAYTGMPTAVAKTISKDLADYASTGWRHEHETGPAETASDKRKLLFMVLKAGGGATLNWTRIYQIIS